jgi:hypothetical protein
LKLSMVGLRADHPAVPPAHPLKAWVVGSSATMEGGEGVGNEAMPGTSRPLAGKNRTIMSVPVISKCG